MNVSGITLRFIRYAQNRRIGKPNNLKVGVIKTKGLNRIAKIGYGHIFPMEENINFHNNYMDLATINFD